MMILTNFFMFLGGVSSSSIIVFSVPLYFFLKQRFERRFFISMTILPVFWLLYGLISLLTLITVNSNVFLSDQDHNKLTELFFLLGFILPIILFGLDQNRWKKNR